MGIADRITSVRLSHVDLPLSTPISDAKVLTGRQKPLTRVAFLFAEITAESGHRGLGFGYSKRAGGPALYAHAREIAPELLGEDPSDTGRLWSKLVWAGASVGRSGVAVQAVAAFDIGRRGHRRGRRSRTRSSAAGPRGPAGRGRWRVAPGPRASWHADRGRQGAPTRRVSRRAAVCASIRSAERIAAAVSAREAATTRARPARARARRCRAAGSAPVGPA